MTYNTWKRRVIAAAQVLYDLDVTDALGYPPHLYYTDKDSYLDPLEAADELVAQLPQGLEEYPS